MLKITYIISLLQTKSPGYEAVASISCLQCLIDDLTMGWTEIDSHPYHKEYQNANPIWKSIYAH